MNVGRGDEQIADPWQDFTATLMMIPPIRSARRMAPTGTASCRTIRDHRLCLTSTRPAGAAGVGASFVSITWLLPSCSGGSTRGHPPGCRSGLHRLYQPSIFVSLLPLQQVEEHVL